MNKVIIHCRAHIINLQAKLPNFFVYDITTTRQCNLIFQKWNDRDEGIITNLANVSGKMIFIWPHWIVKKLTKFLDKNDSTICKLKLAPADRLPYRASASIIDFNLSVCFMANFALNNAADVLVDDQTLKKY